jgi:periplasmic copper chaperone A
MASKTGKITKIGLKKGAARASCVILLLSLASFGASAHIVLEMPQAKLGASYKAVFKMPHGSEIPATGQFPHALKFPPPQLTLVADAAPETKPVDTVTADGKLVIEGAWARPTPEGTSISAGYLKITNRGDKPDTLLGASTPAANSAELHESAVDAEGVMTMRPLENGLEIKPGQTVELKPAGVHIMILGIKAPLKEGETVPVTFDFKSAGRIEVPFAVKPIGGAGEHVH